VGGIAVDHLSGELLLLAPVAAVLFVCLRDGGDIGGGLAPTEEEDDDEVQAGAAGAYTREPEGDDANG